MKERYRVRQGGLMRCCIASLDEAMEAATEPPKEDDRLQCKWCGKLGTGAMIFRDGAWEWDRPKDQPPGVAT